LPLVAPKAVATFLGALEPTACAWPHRTLCRCRLCRSRRSREIGIRVALGAQSQQWSGRWPETSPRSWVLARALALALTIVAVMALRAVTVSTPGISHEAVTTFAVSHAKNREQCGVRDPRPSETIGLSHVRPPICYPEREGGQWWHLRQRHQRQIDKGYQRHALLLYCHRPALRVGSAGRILRGDADKLGRELNHLAP
jgi:hypothetical protein